MLEYELIQNKSAWYGPEEENKDDWIYVTEDSIDGLCVKLYNTSEEAEEAAEVWRLPGKERNVKVVTYKED